MESLRTHQDKIRFIQVRHEEAAAFMACGYAKFTGKLLNGLYDAKLSIVLHD
jgi:pyruvate dehydrogenase (quinone)